ncbi:MAG: hypothetical protein QOG03_88 [Actinomycetota bacterium]|jgi:hypothetical protein|nr:hypothetical protein [Actinomycetota bacterium]
MAMAGRRWARLIPTGVVALLFAGAACQPSAHKTALKTATQKTATTLTSEYVAPSTTTTEAPTTTTTETPTTQPAPARVRPTPTTARPTPATEAPAAASSSCHPSYTGTCIPKDVSDADCAGGSGNGPYYVKEKDIGVIGPDVFGLDADHNGVGCES